MSQDGMSVLHVAACMSAEWGGPVPFVEALAQEQARLGLQVQVLSTSMRTSQVEQPAQAGLTLRAFPQDRLARLWTAHSTQLARQIRRAVRDVDIVHVHEIWHHPHAVACSAARRYEKPYIVTPHGALDSWCLAQKRLRKDVFAALAQRRYLRHAAAVHALTDDEESAIRAFGTAAPIEVIPNAIEVTRFLDLPPYHAFEEMHPELTGKTVILFLARLHPKKGLDILARAFRGVAESLPEAHLVVAGPDSYGYRATIEGVLNAGGLQDRVTFTGMLVGDQKLEALSRADVFVLPSYSEGFSMSILEAMACRLPVLITHQCHFPEVATNKAGIVVNPRGQDVEAALITLLVNPQLRHEMGQRGFRLVESQYTWRHTTERVVRMYERALEGIGAS